MWTKLREGITTLLDWACAAQEDNEAVAICEILVRQQREMVYRASHHGLSMPGHDEETFAMQASCSSTTFCDLLERPEVMATVRSLDDLLGVNQPDTGKD